MLPLLGPLAHFAPDHFAPVANPLPLSAPVADSPDISRYLADPLLVMTLPRSASAAGTSTRCYPEGGHHRVEYQQDLEIGLFLEAR
jgi:hypothetical protein